MSDAARVRLFAVLALVCVVGAAAAIVTATGAGGEAATATDPAARAIVQARRAGRPAVVFRSLHRGTPAGFGRMAVAGPGDGRTTGALRCERLHIGARGGLCLARRGRFAADYEAQILAPDLHVRGAVGVVGTPSRARVSPDGRYGSVTLFVAGHEYSASGSFSTETTLIDLRAGTRIARLEDFTTFRGDRQVTAVDANFWGVTFTRGGDRFYATLATGGRTHLVEGSIERRTMRTIHDNVECPSLSPDGTRVAYKKRVGGVGGPSRLTVLDLATMRETPVAERRSVDDQAEWLDDRRLLYGLGGDIWSARSDGTGTPEPFRRDADSPAVVRG